MGGLFMGCRSYRDRRKREAIHMKEKSALPTSGGHNVHKMLELGMRVIRQSGETISRKPISRDCPGATFPRFAAFRAPMILSKGSQLILRKGGTPLFDTNSIR